MGNTVEDLRIGIIATMIQAIVCGAFLHHAIVNVLVSEFFFRSVEENQQMNNKRTKVQKILVFLLGAALMLDYFGINLDIRNNYGIGKIDEDTNIIVVQHCALLDDDYLCLKCIDGFELKDGACETALKDQ